MSGIYIHGMAKPKKCTKCQFFIPSSSPKYPFVDCKIIGRLGSVLNIISIPIDCPLIPVPDHGRLIDADEIKKRFCGHCEDYGKCREPCFDIKLIDNTQTIIPADKDGDSDG